MSWTVVTDWGSIEVSSRSVDGPFLKATEKNKDGYESILIPLARIRFIRLGKDALAREMDRVAPNKEDLR